MSILGQARSGDTIVLDFSQEGVAVSLGGQPKGTIAGIGFARALLRVWLGERPVDAGLKKALLGT
ncbi:MAG: hypothetical protein HGA47_11100 [Zoogloea sp.]|nr:hypothetical protein [Zoogloea sp.]